MRFTNKDLKNIIIPLFLEQLLVMLVGIYDTIVISYVGEAAVSGVALVNQFNTIFIYIFTVLASGGAVIVSQYIGSRDTDNAEKFSSQLWMFFIMISLLIGAVVITVLCFRQGTEHLVACCSDGGSHEYGIYSCHWPVHGSR